MLACCPLLIHNEINSMISFFSDWKPFAMLLWKFYVSILNCCCFHCWGAFSWGGTDFNTHTLSKNNSGARNFVSSSHSQSKKIGDGYEIINLCIQKLIHYFKLYNLLTLHFILSSSNIFHQFYIKMWLFLF